MDLADHVVGVARPAEWLGTKQGHSLCARAPGGADVALENLDEAPALIARDHPVLVHGVAQAEELAVVAQRLDPAIPDECDEEVDAVAADIDGAADGDGVGRAARPRFG